MSARDELPPCECADAGQEGFNICRPCYALGELGLTPEGLATMRAGTVFLGRGRLGLEFGDDGGAVDVIREWYASKHPRVTP